MIAEEITLQLFKEDKLLARAMGNSELSRNTNKKPPFFRDFTIWATEVDLSLHDGLTTASSTLLVAGEKIPTYKSIGFLIDSTKAEIIHVADSDSCSGGDVANGDFRAAKTDLTTLAELADKTRKEKLTNMNEVNICIKNDAIVALFANKASSERPKAEILLAQEYYKMQTETELPIFIYDSDKGALTPFEITEDEKKNFLLSMRSQLKTLTIGYDIDTEYTQETKQKTLYKKEGNTQLITKLEKLSDPPTPSQQAGLKNCLEQNR
ncbi:MAG: hypothetical protein IKQ99_02250 [Alphaproteobacteria bacterium]|nr:hypothetical protein [Alphaproteobacteria bacterium]